MRKFLITQGGTPVGENRWKILHGITRDYSAEAKRLIFSAIRINADFDTYIIRNNESITSSALYEAHRDVLDQDCFGTAFKPLGFWELLNNEMRDGDVAMWVDSNHWFKADPQPLLDIAIKQGIYARDHWLPGQLPYTNKMWTKRGTFIGMGCDEERYWNSHHLQHNISAVCKCDMTMRFYEEFLTNSLNYDTMFGGNYEEFPEFREHRHEQSIFSVLIEKYNIKYYELPWQIIDELDPIAIN